MPLARDIYQDRLSEDVNKFAHLSGFALPGLLLLSMEEKDLTTRKIDFIHNRVISDLTKLKELIESIIKKLHAIKSETDIRRP